MPIYSIDKAYISYAIGTDLTAWRNADAVLVAGELQATDVLDALKNISIDYTDPETEEVGHMSASQYKTRITTGYKEGKIILPAFLQSGVLLYATLGTCASTDAVAEITTVTCTTKLLSVENSTFHFWVSDGAGATTEYYCWINKGTGADPTETGTAIECDISLSTTATDVAEVIDGLIDAKGDVSAANVAAVLTITNDQAGGVPDCSSSEGTDTGYAIAVTTQGSTTHAISLSASQTPISLAFHFEKELSTEDDRYDFLGYMPDYWKLTCGDDKSRWKARQEFSGRFAYAREAGGDLAEPSKSKLRKFEWNDLKHASGVLTAKYNGTALDFTQKTIDLTVTRTNPLWGVKGANGYPTEAFISGLGIEYLMEGHLKGNNVRSLMATKPEDYAGTGLDVEIKFYKATNNEFGVSLGNLYLVPDVTILNETDWYERKTLRMVPIGSTTSITSSVEDQFNKMLYEND